MPVEKCLNIAASLSSCLFYPFLRPSLFRHLPHPRSFPSGILYRLASFTDDPSGGNPAGAWLGETLPEPAEPCCRRSAQGLSTQ
ncbi:hypothetical protein C1H69_05465 [Billgrantia endophytica]|uniref:Uncharacterized protein n=1 Tax=Billgrantia endophytica TaxID=2033802 RepID=A0A2N7U7T3_9GAMM|nr:hypothetical protein C1H69_05465 [Halomonas endophytica]